MLSRILGFVRDLVLARLFGADALTDAFFVAFKIPNFLRRLFAEGAFATAFVPVLTEYKTQREYRELKHFVDAIAGTLGLVLLIVTAIGVIAAPVVVSLFAFGWVMEGESERLDLAAEMLRLTFPYLFFISLTAFAGGVLNSHKRFAVPAFTPVLLNLSLIGCAIWLSPQMEQPVVALAWGVMIAGISQFVFQIPFLASLKLLPRPRLGFSDPGVKRVLVLMLPALFAVSVTQINLLLDTVLASFLQSGSISWLYYSDRLMEFPLGVLGVALGTVLLPQLSHDKHESDPQQFSRTLDWGIRMGWLFGLPAAIGLGMLALPMMETLFGSERFDHTDSLMASQSLMAYSLGLIAFIQIKVLAPGYYARQDTKTPVKIGVIAMALNMVFNLILIWPLAHAGLALATSLSAFVNAYLLWRGLQKQEVFQAQVGWQKFIIQSVLAGAAMAAVIYLLAFDQIDWFAIQGWLLGALLLGVIAAAAITYFAVLWVSGMRLRDWRRVVAK